MKKKKEISFIFFLLAFLLVIFAPTSKVFAVDTCASNPSDTYKSYQSPFVPCLIPWFSSIPQDSFYGNDTSIAFFMASGASVETDTPSAGYTTVSGTNIYIETLCSAGRLSCHASDVVSSAVFDISGGFVSGSPSSSDTSTHITDILPTNGSITASTSVIVSANYRLNDPDTANYATAPIVLVINLHRTDSIGTPDETFDDNTPVYNAFTPISHTFTLPTNTTWELTFNLSGDGYFFISPLASPVSFSVVSDPSGGTNGYTTCSITALAGCFQNALIYLFYPSQDSMYQFNNLYIQYRMKPPFGYITTIQTALAGLNDTATSIFTLQSMPILNTYVFTPLRVAFGWLLWLAFAFVLFHRFKNIDL